ncbi:MAG TPA: helix-turn-helix domain-containing protein, partial [Solirubrobacteraceae bacterium]|nr:helix-turn-helix domain-containing protein [Solirubrobacteraceae bacterium]
IDLPLNHELIGRLTASRRPTATLALQRLYDEGLLTRLADNSSWKLALSGSSRGGQFSSDATGSDFSQP